MDYILIIGNNVNLKNYDYKNKYVIGIDKGAYLAYLNNIKLDEAIGDFDSIELEELNILKKYTKTTVLNPVKDDTDTAYALRHIKNAEKIEILGSIQGKRIEHLIANIIEAVNDERITLIDDYSKIFAISENFIIKKNEYKFISFYAIADKVNISLSGFKYNLLDYSLKKNDPLCISNEIIEEGTIKVNGKILIIMSKDDAYEVI